MYLFAGGMDFIQFVIIECILVWVFGIGVAINEILDPIVGVIIALWIQFGKKVSLVQHPSRLASLVGMEALSAVTGGIAQLWILDVWYIHSDVKKEEAQMNAEREQEEFLQAGMARKYVEDGVGRARTEQLQPSESSRFYVDGVGRPRGHIQATGPTIGKSVKNAESSFSA